MFDIIGIWRIYSTKGERDIEEDISQRDIKEDVSQGGRCRRYISMMLGGFILLTEERYIEVDIFKLKSLP